jgi:hypothetical protein
MTVPYDIFSIPNCSANIQLSDILCTILFVNICMDILMLSSNKLCVVCTIPGFDFE